MNVSSEISSTFSLICYLSKLPYQKSNRILPSVSLFLELWNNRINKKNRRFPFFRSLKLFFKDRRCLARAHTISPLLIVV